MGCDIHAYIERRTATGLELVGEPDSEAEYNGAWRTPWSLDRSYQLFSLLAGVRSESREVEPISRPRGVPEDATERYREIVSAWAGDGHSHSWHTLEELLAHDWTQMATCSGIVSFETYASYNPSWEKNGPRMYSQGISGPGIEHVSTEEMQSLRLELETLRGASWTDTQLLRSNFIGLHARKHARITWGVSHMRLATTLWLEFMPHLLLAGPGSRMVYFFDN